MAFVLGAPAACSPWAQPPRFGPQPPILGPGPLFGPQLSFEPWLPLRAHGRTALSPRPPLRAASPLWAPAASSGPRPHRFESPAPVGPRLRPRARHFIQIVYLLQKYTKISPFRRDFPGPEGADFLFLWFAALPEFPLFPALPALLFTGLFYTICLFIARLYKIPAFFTGFVPSRPCGRRSCKIPPAPSKARPTPERPEGLPGHSSPGRPGAQRPRQKCSASPGSS